VSLRDAFAQVSFSLCPQVSVGQPGVDYADFHVRVTTPYFPEVSATELWSSASLSTVYALAFRESHCRGGVWLGASDAVILTCASFARLRDRLATEDCALAGTILKLLVANETYIEEEVHRGYQRWLLHSWLRNAGWVAPRDGLTYTNASVPLRQKLQPRGWLLQSVNEQGMTIAQLWFSATSWMLLSTLEA